MKYVLTWRERPGGSHADYEAAQKRVFQEWEMPEIPGYRVALAAGRRVATAATAAVDSWVAGLLGRL